MSRLGNPFAFRRKNKPEMVEYNEQGGGDENINNANQDETGFYSKEEEIAKKAENTAYTTFLEMSSREEVSYTSLEHTTMRTILKKMMNYDHRSKGFVAQAGKDCDSVYSYSPNKLLHLKEYSFYQIFDCYLRESEPNLVDRGMREERIQELVQSIRQVEVYADMNAALILTSRMAILVELFEKDFEAEKNRIARDVSNIRMEVKVLGEGVRAAGIGKFPDSVQKFEVSAGNCFSPFSYFGGKAMISGLYTCFSKDFSSVMRNRFSKMVDIFGLNESFSERFFGFFGFFNFFKCFLGRLVHGLFWRFRDKDLQADPLSAGLLDFQGSGLQP